MSEIISEFKPMALITIYIPTTSLSTVTISFFSLKNQHSMLNQHFMLEISSGTSVTSDATYSE